MYDQWLWLVIGTSGVFAAMIVAAMLVLLWPTKPRPHDTTALDEETARAIQMYEDAAAAHREAAKDPRPSDGSHL